MRMQLCEVVIYVNAPDNTNEVPLWKKEVILSLRILDSMSSSVYLSHIYSGAQLSLGTGGTYLKYKKTQKGTYLHML